MPPVSGDPNAVKTRLLDATQYRQTFVEPMRDVTNTATNVIDIWPYMRAIPNEELWGHRWIAGVVAHVYRNGNGSHDHVLVQTTTKDVYLAVVVDLGHNRILGHHLLDLNEAYGLKTRQ